MKGRVRRSNPPGYCGNEKFLKTTHPNPRKDGQPFWNELKNFSSILQTRELYFVGIQTDISQPGNRTAQR